MGLFYHRLPPVFLPYLLVMAGIPVSNLLDTNMPNSYNEIRAEVAQSVEQRTENPRVPSSILGLGTMLIRAEVAQR
jgi:hypothetical protein